VFQAVVTSMPCFIRGGGGGVEYQARDIRIVMDCDEAVL